MNTLKCITPTMCYSLEENCTEKQMIKNWGWFKGLLAHPLCSENTQRGSASALEFSCVWSRWQRLVHPRLALRLCPRCTHDGPLDPWGGLQHVSEQHTVIVCSSWHKAQMAGHAGGELCCLVGWLSPHWCSCCGKSMSREVSSPWNNATDFSVCSHCSNFEWLL